MKDLIEKLLLIEAKKSKDKDDVVDKAEDPEKDDVPHILMQLRKALDVEGEYPIIFKNGKKVILPIEVIVKFIKKYMVAKPDDKIKMQNRAIESVEGFMDALHKQEKAKPISKIKGDRYLTGFAGDDK